MTLRGLPCQPQTYWRLGPIAEVLTKGNSRCNYASQEMDFKKTSEQVMNKPSKARATSCGECLERALQQHTHTATSEEHLCNSQSKGQRGV
eukprot:784467-Amphidinium_carterae.2